MSRKAVKKPRSWLWLQGAAAGIAVALAPGAALMAAVLLCPALVYRLTETAPGRPVSRTMLLCGSAALFMPLRLLWEHGNTLDDALGQLADPVCALLGWCASAGGWLICETAHVTARIALDRNLKRRTAALQTEDSQLSEEWGLDPQPET